MKSVFLDDLKNIPHCQEVDEWLYCIFGIMTHYLRLMDREAEKAIKNSFAYRQICALGFDDVMRHETPYYWAMSMAHGFNYWTKGYRETPPSDYDEWQTGFLDWYKNNVCL